MSTSSEPDLNLELQLLPSWAKTSPQENRFSSFEGESDGGRGRRGDRGDSFGRERPRGGPRRDGPRPGGGPRDAGGPRGQGQGPRRSGPRDRPGGREQGGGPRREFRDGPRGEVRPQLPPLPEIAATIIPERAGVDSLTRQIKLSGRAYPLFDVAALVAQKPERYHIEFSVVRHNGVLLQRLFLCTIDDTLWLSEDEAARHALSRHFDKFYQAERTATDAPKGNFVQVAVCGMSGAILGPSNWHGYAAALARLYAERFSGMPFEVFKSRVKTVKDEAQVKQWIEEQSFKTEFVCLNIPEPLRLPNREATEKHFHEIHRATAVKEVQAYSLAGPAALALRCPPLRELARRTVDEQRRFPLKVVNVLSQQFSSLGLHFFKKDKTVTYVSVARPNYLDTEATPVSTGVKRIIDFINATPGCTRLKLLEALAPGLAAAHTQPQPAQPPATGDAPAAETAPVVSSPVVPSPAESAVVADLHWLIHEGHVLDFSNGNLETAKRPNPKPQPQAARKDAGYLPVFLGNVSLLAGV